MTTAQTFSFRPRARLLQILGDQLIGSPRLAVFELVKNAYDGTDDQRHFTNIASIIENNIGADCGPFVLVVWTEYPDRCDALRDFLDERLQSAKPLAVLGLPKERFINVASGTVTDAVGLRDGVLNLINDLPQLAALLAWESDVLVAAGNTLSSLLSLVPADQRSMADYPKALDTTLGLARSIYM